jgi:hypothetical protein
MTIEDAIAVVDAALDHKRLSNIQEQLFRQTWEGKTYAEIAEVCGYDSSYIRDVGYRLWQMLTKGFGESPNIICKSWCGLMPKDFRRMSLRRVSRSPTI